MSVKHSYLFIDETGDHGLLHIDPNNPVFLLCGILIDSEEYQRWREKLNVIKTKYWGDKTVHFHSRDIRKCQKEFQILLDLKLKAEFYNDINEAIKSTDFTVICAGIKKQEFIHSYGKLINDVYEVCLSFILERTIFKCDEYGSIDHKISSVVECRGKKEDRRLTEYFNKILSVGTGYVSKDRFARYNMNLNFRDKKANVNGIQLADLIAYPIGTFIKDKDRANPAYEAIKDKIYTKNGKIYGMKISP